MSIQAVGWVLDHSQAEGLDRLVLISLANHANQDGFCWPAQRTIAREAGVSHGTVGNCVASLVTIGEIEVVNNGDSRRSATYRILYPSAHVVGAAPNPGVGAAPNPGLGRTVMNRHEPSAELSTSERSAPKKPRTRGTTAYPPSPLDRCPECRLLEIDCGCMEGRTQQLRLMP